MNPLELRYEIYKFLIGLGRPASLVNAILESPEPGTPCAIEVVTDDPFASTQARRRYRVTVEEIT